MFKINRKHFKFLDEISKILYTGNSLERANNNAQNNQNISNNNSVILNKLTDVPTINPIIKLFEKINSNMCKFFLKVTIFL